MSGRKKDLGKSLDRCSERPIPLNVETILVEGARKPRRFTPVDENEKLKADDSQDTIREDQGDS